MRIILCLLLCFLPLPSFADDLANENTKLNLSKGTKQLGGIALLQLNKENPDIGPSDVGTTINLSPTGGYFIADGLELSARVGLGLHFGDMYHDLPIQLGIAFGIRYICQKFSSILPYAGAAAGISISIPDTGTTRGNASFELPLGALVPINQYLALDLGIRIAYLKSLNDQGGASLTASIGYLGIQSFF